MIPLLSFGKIRPKLFIITAVFFSSIITTLAPASPVFGAAPSAFSEMATQTERWMRMRGIYGCLNEKGTGYVSSSQVIDGEYIPGGETAIGYLNEDGKVSCQDGAFVTNSNNKIGFIGNDYSYCAAQPSAYRTDGPDTKEASDVEGCVGGGGSYNNAASHGTIADQWLSGLKSQVSDYKKFMTDNGGQLEQSKYYMYYQSLVRFCGAKQGDIYNGTDREKSIVSGDEKKVVINYVNGTGDIQPYVYTLSRDQDDVIDDVYQELGNDSNDLSCEYMAERTWALDDATASWVKNYNVVNADAPTEDVESINAPAPTENTTACAVDGIGWIVCPIMTFVGIMNDAAFGFLNNILGIQPAVVMSKAVNNAWSAFRDIANVAFVIAFMFIVYSQITGAGISNYGVKRMLPRIVIAAILVNISFYICAIAVDISNIVGASVYDLFKESLSANINADISKSGWESVMGGILTAGVVGIGAILLVVAIFMAPMVLLAFGLVILILVARQAFVVLLIVMSPLAFVAYLLPNTEDWFKKWYKAFIAVLMVYPVVGVIFGASTLAANVLSSVAADTEDGTLLQLIALGVLAVPLFAVPVVLKGSLAAAGSIGAKLQGVADRSQRGATNKGKARLNESGVGQFMKYRQQQKMTNRALARGGQSAGSWKNPLNLRRNATAAVMSRFNSSAASGAFGDRLSAAGTAIADKEWDEEVGRQKTSMTSLSHEQLLATMKDKKATAERRAAAAGTIMSRGYREGHLQALEAAHGDANDPAMSSIQKQMSHDMKDKPWALSDGAVAQLQIGTYGKENAVIDPATGQPKIDPATGQVQKQVINNITQDIAVRTEKKLSAASVASMNPDELKRIHKLATDGSLSAPQLANLKSAIADAESNDLYKDTIKPEASSLFNDIKALP